MTRKSKYDQPKMQYVSKGWGYERWIVNKDEYCGKLLYFAKGRQCSLHYHKNKDETFYIQSGKALILYYDDLANLEELIKLTPPGRVWKDVVDTITLNPGDNFYVPPGRVHQIIALQNTELFEFSTKHEDSDSYRLVKGD